MKAGYRQSEQHRDNAGTTLTPSCANPPTLSSSVTAGSAAPSKGKTWSGKSASCEKDTPTPKSCVTSAAGSTSVEKDLSPYWSDFIEAISSELWLPIEAGSPGSDSSSSSGLPNRTAAGSWFSTTRITALFALPSFRVCPQWRREKICTNNRNKQHFSRKAWQGRQGDRMTMRAMPPAGFSRGSPADLGLPGFFISTRELKGQRRRG